MDIDSKHFILILFLVFLSILSNTISVKNSDYTPDKSIFCGMKQLPQGYGRYGSRYECLRRGFGAGMNRNENSYPFKKYVIIILIVIFCIMLYNWYQSKNQIVENEKIQLKNTL